MRVRRRYFLLGLDEEETPEKHYVTNSGQLWGSLTDRTSDKAQGLKPGSRGTSMCLSSSFSSVGYLSRRMKGLLRPVVSTRIPGLLAPFDSMNSPRSSLSSRGKEGERRGSS